MRKVLDILRLALEGGRSQREIAGRLALSQSTVSECLARFWASGPEWPLAPALDEAALEGRLFPRPPGPIVPTGARPLLSVHAVLRAHYQAWSAGLDPVLRQEHKAGERCFVDYAGPTMAVLPFS